MCGDLCSKVNDRKLQSIEGTNLSRRSLHTGPISDCVILFVSSIYLLNNSTFKANMLLIYHQQTRIEKQLDYRVLGLKRILFFWPPLLIDWFPCLYQCKNLCN